MSAGEPGTTDQRLDRILQSLQEVSIGLEAVRVAVDGLVRVSADHETRLRTLEQWRHGLTPLVAVATFVLGSLFSAWLRRFGA